MRSDESVKPGCSFLNTLLSVSCCMKHASRQSCCCCCSPSNTELLLFPLIFWTWGVFTGSCRFSGRCSHTLTGQTRKHAFLSGPPCEYFHFWLFCDVFWVCFEFMAQVTCNINPRGSFGFVPTDLRNEELNWWDALLVLSFNMFETFSGFWFVTWEKIGLNLNTAVL